jgi:hypothetical protein
VVNKKRRSNGKVEQRKFLTRTWSPAVLSALAVCLQLLSDDAENRAQGQVFQAGLLAHSTSRTRNQPVGDIQAVVAAILTSLQLVKAADRTGVQAPSARLALVELPGEGLQGGGDSFNQPTHDPLSRLAVANPHAVEGALALV